MLQSSRGIFVEFCRIPLARHKTGSKNVKPATNNAEKLSVSTAIISLLNENITHYKIHCSAKM